MLKFYRDHNSHVAGVYQRDKTLALFITLKADGLKCLAVSSSQFSRTYTRPLEADPRKAALTWFCRALTKTRNDPRAFQLLGEIIMTKKLEEMTMEEVINHHNEIATELGKPTVDSFKSLKAARAAVEKLTKPAAAPKAKKEPADPEVTGRGPVQGVGAFAKTLLLEGLTNKEVLDKTLEQFPNAKTSISCISYYRSKLVADGKLAGRAKKEAANEEQAAA
jgi:hypothetical protein